MRVKRTRSVKYLPALAITMMACSGGEWNEAAMHGEEWNEAALSEEFGQVEESVTLMDKPGTEAGQATEAGQDIEQTGVYTVYSANGDSHVTGTYEGSMQLFKNGVSLASYQVRTPLPSTRIGYHVAMSENFIVTDVQDYPLGNGQVKQSMLIVGKTNGEFASCGSIASNGNLPNCVTCTGSGAQASCTPKPGMSIVPVPPGFDDRVLFELEGNELFVAEREGGSQIVPLKFNGSTWVQSPRLAAPLPGESIGASVALSGNRLAVSATAANGVTTYVYIYERTNSSAPWRNVLRINSPTPNVGGFGRRLDLSGNYLVASDNSKVHFIELSAAALTNPATAITAGCTADTQTYQADIAISGNRVVVASTDRLPLTFERSDTWRFFGGLPSGMFPKDLHNGQSTQFSLWGAAIDGTRAAIGWRNYRGDNPATETGAAIGFDFNEYSCGSISGVPGAGLIRSRPVTIAAINAPSHAGYPASNAIDGSQNTRWRAAATPGTRFEIDLGDYENLSHFQINWGNIYAKDYLVEMNSDPDSVPANQRTWEWLAHVTNGVGGAEFVSVHNNPQAFARRVRLTLNLFGGSGDSGVSISEVKAHGTTSAACEAKPSVTCNTPATAVAPPHVCANDCGRQDENFGCYCDAQCAASNDCCSPNGAAQGSQYYNQLTQVCSL